MEEEQGRAGTEAVVAAVARWAEDLGVEDAALALITCVREFAEDADMPAVDRIAIGAALEVSFGDAHEGLVRRGDEVLDLGEGPAAECVRLAAAVVTWRRDGDEAGLTRALASGAIRLGRELGLALELVRRLDERRLAFVEYAA